MPGKENKHYHHSQQHINHRQPPHAHPLHNIRGTRHEHAAGNNNQRKKRNRHILAVLGAIIIIMFLAFAAARYTEGNGREENKHVTGKDKPEQPAPPEKALNELQDKIMSSEYAAEYILNLNGHEKELKLYFTKTGATSINGNNKRMLAKINGKEIILECITSESKKWACAQSIKEDMTKTILERNLKDMKWKESIKVGGKDAECFERRELRLCYDTDGKLVYARKQGKTGEEITLKKELPPEEAERETELSQRERKASEQPPPPTGINDACSKCELLAESEREMCYDEC